MYLAKSIRTSAPARTGVAASGKRLSHACGLNASLPSMARSHSMRRSFAPREDKWSVAIRLAAARAAAATVADSTEGDEQDFSERGARKKVAYQGVPGAFCEEATMKAHPDWEEIPCKGFETALQALNEYMVDRAVLPIENSIAGSLHSVYDLILRYRMHIVGEVTLKISHNLAVLPGVKKHEVQRVASHPQALVQCDSFLRDMSVVREEVYDTAAAAMALEAEGRSDSLASRNRAVICSERAASMYGLEIIESDIQDSENNFTRYLVLAKDPLLLNEIEEEVAHGRVTKTSIVFSNADPGPGQLFRALSVFALRDIDVTKIESRPMRSNPLVSNPAKDSGRRYNYLFYMDFVGRLSEERVQNALRHLSESTSFLHVLGSYPQLGDDGSNA